MPNNDVDLITTREAADILEEGVRQTIRRVERGNLTPAKKLPGIRGSYLFNRADIDALSSPVVPDVSAGSAGDSVAPERRSS